MRAQRLRQGQNDLIKERREEKVARIQFFVKSGYEFPNYNACHEEKGQDRIWAP